MVLCSPSKLIQERKAKAKETSKVVIAIIQANNEGGLDQLLNSGYILKAKSKGFCYRYKVREVKDNSKVSGLGNWKNDVAINREQVE